MKVDFSYACPKRWTDMSGTDQRRHCAACDKTVHNLSAMGRERAQRLLDAPSRGEICVTALHDRDRNVVFDRRLFRMAAATPLLALSTAALADGQIPDLTVPTIDDIAQTIDLADEALEDASDADCDKGSGAKPGELIPKLEGDEHLYITGGVYIDPGPPLVAPPAPPDPQPVVVDEPAADSE